MFIKERMLKDKNVSSGADTTRSTRDGELSIKTRPKRMQLRDTTATSVSTSEDHSISDQECQ
jgi:hypothetical protein